MPDDNTVQVDASFFQAVCMTLSSMQSRYDFLKQELDWIKDQLKLGKDRQYGKSSETIPNQQLELPGLAEFDQEIGLQAKPDERKNVEGHTRKAPSRKITALIIADYLSVRKGMI